MARIASGIVFASSVIDDVWHPKPDTNGYELWHFDALSDNGRDFFIISFYDNLYFSPRYYQNFRTSGSQIFPAVSFAYYSDAKPLYRTINEFDESELEIINAAPFCKIADSGFQIEATPYGIRYKIAISLRLKGDQKLKGSFEFLLVESNFLPAKAKLCDDRFYWNAVATRADVTGKIEVFGETGAIIDQLRFRGSGYHDRKMDARLFSNSAETIRFGHTYFSDVSAAFVLRTEAKKEPEIALAIIDGEHPEKTVASFSETRFRYNKYGRKYATDIEIESEKGHRIAVKLHKTLESNCLSSRFIDEFTLTAPN